MGQLEGPTEVPGGQVRTAGEGLDIQRLCVLPIDPVPDPTCRYPAPPERPTLPVAGGRLTFRVLLRSAGAHPRLTAGAVLLTCVAGVGVVAAPFLLGELVDMVRAGTTFSGLLPLLVGATVVVVLTAGFTAWSSREAQRLGATIAADLREQVLERSLRLPAPVLEEVGPGDVASRITEDVENFDESVPLGAMVFTSLITVLWSIAGFAVLDWRLALAFLAVAPVYAIALRWYLPRAAPLYARERRLAATRSGVMLQTLHGLPTVRGYGTGELQTRRIRAASEQNLGAGLAALSLFARFGIFMNGAEAVGLSALLVVGHLLVTADAATIGAVTAAALLFHRLFGPLGILLMSFDDVQRAGAALARMVGVATLPTRSRLRDWIGIVTQETHVFSGSVRDDVTLTAPDSSDGAVGEALELVGAGGWVAALPDGLDTVIGAGGHPLTAVQAQQLALARVALRNPPVVILDEATAEAGSAGAQDLEKAATALLRGRTAVVVAHRLTQARACDRIAVMDHGRIVELGSHDELVAGDGRYAELWATWTRR